MSNIVTGVIGGTVSVGRSVVNEYVLTVSAIGDGYRLTVRRGSEEQVMELRGLTEDEIAALRSAEQGRADAEALRVVAEAARARAEGSRADAEAARALAENTRESAERARVDAESTRRDAEDDRTTAEAARASGEEARVEAEIGRAAAEMTRHNAEAARNARWRELSGEAEQAVADAGAAARSANDAARDAGVALAEVVERASPAIVCAAGPAATVAFRDGADGVPLRKLAVTLLPVQAGDGDAGPANIRPISGHTSVQLNHNAEPVAHIAFPDEAGTVYAGELDVVSGKLTVYGGATTIGALDWEYYEDTQVFRTTVAGKNNSYELLLCSAYRTVNTNLAAADMPDQTFKEHYGTASAYRNVCYIKDTRFATPEALVEAMGSQTIVYRRRNPVVYQLTPARIVTALGENSFSADCGPLELEYVADTKLYINGGLPADGMIAAANIARSGYFQVGNALYQATSAIAAGETIVPGANCTAITLAQALNALAQ